MFKILNGYENIDSHFFFEIKESKIIIIIIILEPVSCNGASPTYDRSAELFWNTPKAGFTLRTQIYGAYADHFAHLGRVFSATNADLRRRDRSCAECKHSYNTPSFTRGCWIVIG